MAVSACTDVGYRSSNFERHSRVATDVFERWPLGGPPIRLCAMTQGGLQHDEAFEYEDCKAHCRLIAVTWVVFIQLTESAS